jgi:hypothetical protein
VQGIATNGRGVAEFVRQVRYHLYYLFICLFVLLLFLLTCAPQDERIQAKVLSSLKKAIRPQLIKPSLTWGTTHNVLTSGTTRHTRHTHDTHTRHTTHATRC